MKLIYITNNRIPSEKANSYQTFSMCEAFSKYFSNVELWYPKRKNTKDMRNTKDIFSFYGVKKTFALKSIPCLDLLLLKKINEKIWFRLLNLTFSLTCSLHILHEKEKLIIFSRDKLSVLLACLLRKIKLLHKTCIFFEAHSYSHTLKNVADCSDGIITVTDFLRKKILKISPKAKTITARNGIKIQHHSTNKHANATTKEIKKVLYTGNLFKWKGVYTLADSSKYLNNNVKIIIVGGSPENIEEFRNYVELKGYDNIEIIGFVRRSDLSKYLSEADVFVLPNSSSDEESKFYTSPIKLFEYMLNRKPIVASNLPSINEILKDKVNAVLFEPDNPEDLANKIKWCLENNTARIVEQAYKDVQQYSWDKRAERIYNFIKETCKNKK